MAIHSINNYTQPVHTGSTAGADRKAQAEDTSSKASTASKEEAAGVIYEKSSSTDTRKTNTSYKTQNTALVAKMKADTDNRLQQLQGIVSQMMNKQGAAIGTADSMWRFLAGGNFTVTAAAKAQAEKDIAEDGYWGVNQTSDRIVDFAKALSGDDPSKAEELMNAFKKGFSQATKSWGKTLPDISQRTYDAVMEKFDTWMNGDKTQKTEETEA